MADAWGPDYPLPEELRGLSDHALAMAIEDFRAKIRRDPQSGDPYHVLFHLYVRAQEYDRAWCVAGVVAAFGQATRTEGEFYRDKLEEGVVQPDRPLDHATWVQSIMSEGQPQMLSEVFATLYEAAGDALYAKSLKDFGLKEANRIDLDAPTLLTRTLRDCARALGLSPPPTLYGHEDGRAIRCLPTWPMVIAVGPDMLSGRTAAEIGFLGAKAMAYCHRWHPMAALYDPSQLHFILLAAARLVAEELAERIAPQGPSPEMLGQVKTLQGQLKKRLKGADRDRLAGALRRCFERGGAPDTAAWDKHVELTANHAALYVTDDLEQVGRFLLREFSDLSPLDRGEKVRDFVEYALGERYLSLREEMGIQIAM
jgi:hypothetical protein